MKCPLCSQKMIFFYNGVYNRCGLSDYKFSLVKCNECNFFATDPLPTNEVYSQSRDDNDLFLAINTTPWNKKLLKRVQAHKDSGSLLEIGCNNGDFIEMAAATGFKVLGVEIDEVAAKAGISVGRNIIHGDALKLNFEERFDVIVMNHVLEHIPEITEVPKKLKELLKDDGVVIINVPNISGTIAQIMMQNWCQMAPFTHLWFFSRTSMKRLFINHFKSIEFKTNTNCEPIGFIPFNLKMWVKTIIVLIANFFNKGDELHVILKGPNS